MIRIYVLKLQENNSRAFVACVNMMLAKHRECFPRAFQRSVKETMELTEWIGAQMRRSTEAMERAISATHLRRSRNVFGQLVVPAKGSVLASPAIADWNPEPDYFFHWIRDSAIVMRVVADLMEDAPDENARRHWRGLFEDFVRFSLALTALDGAAFLDRKSFRDETREDYRKFLRPDAEIAELAGDTLLGEPRFNPDGSIDVFRWSRPQYDGPALRAIACLRYLAAGGEESDETARVLRRDLDFTILHAGECCIGQWEEADENTHHYYVALAQLGAVVHGHAWIDAATRTAVEHKLRECLAQHWSEQHQVYMAIRPARAGTADDLVDAAALLAVLDADLPHGPHSIVDPRVQQTFAVIEDVFAREFPINAGRTAPALGRSRKDRYFGGGAWYPTTLAAASLCYRLARRDERHEWLTRGDAYMATVRALTPDDGSLSEQVDRVTGKQTSARDLTWSYAAFISAALLRAKALR
jgi:glucoamylase